MSDEKKHGKRIKREVSPLIQKNKRFSEAMGLVDDSSLALEEGQSFEE